MKASMYSINDIRAKVRNEQADEKFASDLAKNLNVIEDRIRRNYAHQFSLYGGGHPERMAIELLQRGLSCRIDDTMIMATL